MNPADLELHAWPPRTPGGGQQTGRVHYGVLAVHKRTGAAVVVTSEQSQHANQKLAEERLGLLVATLPWGES